MKKRFISAVLASALAIAAMTVTLFAAAPTISVGTASGNPGDTVTVEVSLENNPGICAVILTPEYDTTALRLESSALADGFSGMFEGDSRLVWVNMADITENGKFLTMTFTVLDSARKGDSEVTVTYSDGDISNWDEQDVDFEVVKGKVEILSDGTGTAAPAATESASDNESSSRITSVTAASAAATEKEQTSKPAGDSSSSNTVIIVVCVAVALAAVVLVCVVVKSKKKNKTVGTSPAAEKKPAPIGAAEADKSNKSADAAKNAADNAANSAADDAANNAADKAAEAPTADKPAEVPAEAEHSDKESVLADGDASDTDKSSDGDNKDGGAEA